MTISPRDLAAQYARFSAAYPFVHDVEAAHGLAPFTLFAVASRETNMTDEVGDGGHGHGAWQLDDRSHHIPDPFPVTAQADVAAAMLAGLRHRFGDWISAYNAYNSGQPQTRFTAHGDYGPDVDARRAWLAANIPAPPPGPSPPTFMELDVQLANTAKTGFLSAPEAGVPLGPRAGYLLHADGGVDAINSAPFYGGWFDIDPADRANQPNGPFLAITPRRDGAVGYELQRFDGAYYTMGPGLNGFAT